MGKGLLSGVAWGALVSVLALGGASVLAPLPEQVAAVPAVPVAGGLEAPSADAAPEAPQPAPAGGGGAVVESELSPPPGSEFARAGEDTKPAAPQADAGPVVPVVPQRPGAEVAEAPAPDTAPPAVPETATEGVAAPVAPVVEEAAPVIGGGDGAAMAPEAPETAAQPEAGRVPATAEAAAPQVPRSTPEAVVAQDVASSAATAEAVEAAEAGDSPASAPVVATEVARSGTAERAAPVQADAAQERVPDAVVVAPATGDEVARAKVSGNEGALAAQEGRTEVAAAAPAEVVTGTAPAAPAAEPAAAAPMTPAAPDSAKAVPPAPAEGAAEPAAEAPEEDMPEVVEIVTIAPDAAAQPVPEAEAPVAETPATPMVPDAASEPPAQATPGRESPATTAQAPARPEAEQPGARRETELPARPSAPPSSVPMTERQPRSGLPGKIVTEGESSGRFGKRVVPLTERNKPASRLPSVGDDAATQAEAEVEAPRLSALAANAAPFENPDSKPLVSVILFDVGDQGLDRAALKAINFPVTFAVDPTDPGAAGIAQGYRDAGFEVLILPAGLPKGATPQDLETTLQSYFAQFPAAAGLLETGEEGVTGNPALTRQLLAIAEDTGHGLVFVDSGLNAGHRGAQSAGLASALIWKQLDAAGESGAAIGRTLDRAAFRADQDGAVVVMGHSYSQTVTSLLDWAAGRKGQSVALAPVSAVMMH